MQIINDTEVFEPGECLFALGYDDPSNTQYLTVCITDKATWDERECLNDCFGDHSLPEDAIPNGIWNSMEATWETKMRLEQAHAALLSAGFVEGPPAMYEFLFSKE